MNRIYARSLDAFLKKRISAIPITLLMVVAIGILWSYIPAEMAPMEDRSQISINTRAAEGASYEYIRDYTEDINHLVDSLCLMPNRLRHVCRAVVVISVSH